MLFWTWRYGLWFNFVAHSHLYNVLGILHHDISINNILLHRLNVYETIGLLIDFDYGEFINFKDIASVNSSPATSNESVSDASDTNAASDISGGATHYESIRTVSAENFILDH